MGARTVVPKRRIRGAYVKNKTAGSHSAVFLMEGEFFLEAFEEMMIFKFHESYEAFRFFYADAVMLLERDDVFRVGSKNDVCRFTRLFNKKFIGLSKVSNDKFYRIVFFDDNRWRWNIMVKNFCNNKAFYVGHDNGSMGRKIVRS